MEEIKAWIEKHPYLTSGLVVGIIVLFYLLSGSSSNASTASAGNGDIPPGELSLSEAQLASGTQLQAQSDQLTAQQNELNAGLSAAAIQAATTNTANQLAAQTADQNIGGQVSIAQIQGNTQVSTAGIQGQVLEDQYNQQTAQQGIIANAQTAQTQISGDVTAANNLLTAQTIQQGQQYAYASNLLQAQELEQQNNNSLALGTTQAQLNAQTNAALIALLGKQTGTS